MQTTLNTPNTPVGSVTTVCPTPVKTTPSTWTVLRGECRERMQGLPDNSVDSVVVDPPYGLSREPDAAEVLRHWLAGDDYKHGSAGFGGAAWDSFVPGPEYWRECLRVLKPGGHLLAFSAPRTYDLMTLAVRLAGFEVRDQILAWTYATGFPKSHDVSRAIDKAAGAKGKLLAQRSFSKNSLGGGSGWKPNSRGASGRQEVRAPATPEAQQWYGWNTALKPAQEPIVVARKPLKGTVAANVVKHGTGALNIGRCRIGPRAGTLNAPTKAFKANPEGRWPANFALSHLPDCTAGGCTPHCPVAALDADTGGASKFFHISDWQAEVAELPIEAVMRGEAVPFNYCAKPSGKERDAGLVARTGPGAHAARAGGKERLNGHLTVKPVELMRWLVRLVTPPGGIVLDPFCGSGTTGCAVVAENASAHTQGWSFIGIEADFDNEGFAEMARARIRHWAQGQTEERLDAAEVGEAQAA